MSSVLINSKFEVPRFWRSRIQFYAIWA